MFKPTCIYTCVNVLLSPLHPKLVLRGKQYLSIKWTYVTFKSELHVEDYHYYVTHRRARSLLGQFTMGILPLFVETGRYSNIPLERRLCIYVVVWMK